MRLVYYTMVGEFNSLSLHPLNDESWIMLKSMFLLVFMSIISGSMLSWLIFPIPYMICLPIYLKLLTLFVCLIGGLSGYIISLSSLNFYNKSLMNNKLVNFISLMWFMPMIFTLSVNKLPLMLGSSMKLFDQGWSEYFGSNNLFNYLKDMSKYHQLIYLNSLKLYLLSFLFWIIFILMLFMKF